MNHKIEQLEPTNSESYTKDIGWEPECGSITVTRIYSDTKIRVSEVLVSNAFEIVPIFCHRHGTQIRTDSTLHEILAETFPNHLGWGYFGVISYEDNVLHIEWRGH